MIRSAIKVLTVAFVFFVTLGAAFADASDSTPPPGVVVCDPAYPAGAAKLADFARGCGAWLQYTVGGRPEFGQTPAWNVLNRALIECHGDHDMAVTDTQAQSLGKIFGVTHAVTGTISEEAGVCHLSLTVLAMTGGNVLDAPVVLSGSRTQIVNQLPAAAAKIIRIIGNTPVATPSAVNLTADELAAVGAVRWSQDPSDTKWDNLPPMSKSGLVGVLKLNKGSFADVYELLNITASVVTLAPNNPPAVASAMLMSPTEPDAGVKSAFDALLLKYPNDVALLTTSVARLASINRDAALAAAEKLAQAAPDSPTGHWTLSRAIGVKATAFRNGRSMDVMTDEEINTVTAYYQRALKEAKMATDTDPEFGAAWLEVSVEAAYADDRDTAEKAVIKAIKFMPGSIAGYLWAMQMYLPTWLDKPDLLDKLAADASSDPSLSLADMLTLGAQASRYGRAADAAKIVGSVISQGEDEVTSGKASRADVNALIGAYTQSGKTAQAQKLYQSLLDKSPTTVAGQLARAQLAMVYGTKQDAIDAYTAALKINPDLPGPHIELAMMLFASSRYLELEAEWRECIRLMPNTKNYAGLVRTLLKLKRNSAAARAANEGLAYDPSDSDLNTLLKEARSPIR